MAIKQQIDSLCGYLDDFKYLINSHMVNYFTDSLFNHLPIDLRNEIETIGYENTLKCIYNQQFNETKHLKNFVIKAKQNYLSNTPNVLTKNDFINHLTHLGYDTQNGKKLDVFMNPKKSHEVEILSGLISTLHNLGNCTHVVDLGDGKGYISSMLAFNYQIPTLGIDSLKSNTEGAAKRAVKLAKRWPFLNNSEIPTCNLYKQTTELITENCNLSKCVEKTFKENKPCVTLVGLHTCGNLGAISMKLFNENCVKILCNISCCYHLLNEPEHYPMSTFLKNKQHHLGQLARMLSCQSPQRITSEKNIPKRTLFYRSLLQVFLINNLPELKQMQVGRMKKTCNSFYEYVIRALKDHDEIVSCLDEKTIEDICSRYQDLEYQLYVFYLLKSIIAPAIEALILLDRLLFLHENGHSNSFLVELFDPVISPRCYAIVAFK